MAALSEASQTESRVIDSYLDLLEKALVGYLYKDPAIPNHLKKKATIARVIKQLVSRKHKKESPHDEAKRDVGTDWPSIAPSMIGRKRMNNIRQLCEDVIKNNIQGDFIETGVWRGGACIYARAILNAYGQTHRTVWCADSFEGLPKPNGTQYPADTGDRHHEYTALAISIEEVRENFRRYGLLDDNVKFLKGWFKDTLPTAPIEKLAILRLDGDMYESTMDGLKLYDKVSVGGYVIVDDYGCILSCRKAIHDFRDKHNIQDPIIDIDGIGVYWKKTR